MPRMPAASITRFLDLSLRIFPQLQSKGQIVVDRHMGIERVVLENHRDIAIFRRNIIHPPIADKNIALRDLFQSGDHPQGRGFAAAGRPDQNDKFPVLDFEIDVVTAVTSRPLSPG